MTLILVAATFVAGAGIGYFFVAGASQVTSLVVVGVATLIAALGAGYSPSPGRWRLRWGVAAALFLGVLRGYMAVHVPAELPPELRSVDRVMLEAVLDRDARSYGDAYVLSVDVQKFMSDGSWLPAGFRADVVASQLSGASALGRAPDGFQAGDRYLISGEIVTATWSPAASRQSSAVVRNAEVKLIQEEGAAWRNALGSVRSHLNRSIDRTGSEPAAGLTKALLTGDRSGLSSETRAAFRRSGTSHVLAVSGFNIGIFAAMSLSVAAWLFGKRRQSYLLLPAIAIWGYAAIAGFAPPVTRAAIMASVYIGGRALGRQRDAAPALALAAAVMVGLDPSLPGDVSFQLSFLAVAGLILVTPGVNKAGLAIVDSLPKSVPEYAVEFLKTLNSGIAMSMGAISMTAPIVALRFDSLSAWGTPATLLQVPALPFLTILGGVQAAFGLIWHPLGVGVGLLNWGLAAYVIEIAEIFARLPGGAIRPTAPVMVGACAYYVALVALLNRERLGGILARASPTWATFVDAARGTPATLAPPRKPASRLLLLVILASAGLVWAGALALPEGALRITYFETEGGDSILIRTPSGRQVLIDGGDSTLGAVRALSSRMPFWDRSLDIVVLSHPHADHVRGLLAVLERYRVDAILDSPSHYDSIVYGDWLELADREGARRIAAVPGAVFELDRDLRMEVVSAQPEPLAPDPNDRSVVLRLTYGGSSFLFTGDLSSVAERRLLDAGVNVQANVLKVGHQGSRGSSSDAFLAAVRPSIAVVPASIGNQFGHPHAEALARIRRFVDAERLLVTMDRGTVDLETDGRSYRVRTAR